MLGEMLGELNGSHTGARYYAPSSAPAVATLGAFYDNDYKGNGLKVKEVSKTDRCQEPTPKSKPVP